MKHLLFISLVCLSAVVKAQEAKVVLVIPSHSTISSDRGNNRPTLLLPDNNENINGKRLNLDAIRKLTVMVFDEAEPANNQEFVFTDFDSNSKYTIYYENEEYQIFTSSGKLRLAKIKNNGVSRIKSDVQMEYSTNFECKNHNPAHRYSNPDNVDPACCFTTGCG